MEPKEIPICRFSPGNIVRLKSGGPRMTVHEIRGCLVECTFWSEPHQEYKGATFGVDELRLVVEY